MSPLVFGVPSEIKDNERRVALTRWSTTTSILAGVLAKVAR